MNISMEIDFLGGLGGYIERDMQCSFKTLIECYVKLPPKGEIFLNKLELKKKKKFKVSGVEGKGY
jgi:hypothetical protein